MLKWVGFCQIWPGHSEGPKSSTQQASNLKGELGMNTAILRQSWVWEGPQTTERQERRCGNGDRPRVLQWCTCSVLGWERVCDALEIYRESAVRVIMIFPQATMDFTPPHSQEETLGGKTPISRAVFRWEVLAKLWMLIILVDTR